MRGHFLCVYTSFFCIAGPCVPFFPLMYKKCTILADAKEPTFRPWRNLEQGAQEGPARPLPLGDGLEVVGVHSADHPVWFGHCDPAPQADQAVDSFGSTAFAQGDGLGVVGKRNGDADVGVHFSPTALTHSHSIGCRPHFSHSFGLFGFGFLFGTSQ